MKPNGRKKEIAKLKSELETEKKYLRIAQNVCIRHNGKIIEIKEKLEELEEV